MKHLCFYDVPVYRLSEDKYYTERDIYTSRFIENGQQFYENNPDQKRTLIEHLHKSFGGVWEFNEIIGYVRLYVLGSQIRGEYYVNDVKRHAKTRKKQFVSRTHKLAVEIELPHSGDNVAIYQTILAYLAGCRKELPGRYIDTSHFEQVGPFVDWKNLIL